VADDLLAAFDGWGEGHDGDWYERQAAKMAEGRRRYLRERKDAGLSSVKNPLERAAENPGSLRAAVNAKCFDCQGGDADPAWRWRIGNCDATGCPLTPVRPYQHLCGTPMPAALKEALGD
jgi:ribosomal protein L44E